MKLNYVVKMMNDVFKITAFTFNGKSVGIQVSTTFGYKFTIIQHKTPGKFFLANLNINGDVFYKIHAIKPEEVHTLFNMDAQTAKDWIYRKFFW